MGYNIPTLEAFKDKLSALREKNNLKNNNNIQFRLDLPQEVNSENSAVLRILLNPHTADNSPFVEVYNHYDIGDQKVVACPKYNHGESCAICEQRNMLYKKADTIARESGIDTKNKDEMRKNPKIKYLWSIAHQINIRKRVYIPVIVRNNEAEGVKYWVLSDKSFEKLLNDITRAISRNPKKSPINPYDGVDIELIKTNDGSDYGSLRWVILSDVDASPAISGGEEAIDKLIASVPNVWGTLSKKRSESEVEKIVEDLSDEEGILDLSSAPKEKVTTVISGSEKPVQDIATKVSDEVANAIDDIDEEI